jgi:hypothetical protein
MATSAIEEFQRRYFRLGLKSFADEIGRDFARLETTRTRTVSRLVSTMRTLSPVERLDFGRALIMRRRLLGSNGCEIDGEVMSPADISMCQQFFDDFALNRSDEELRLEEERRSHPDRFKIPRRKLLAMVENEVGPILGTLVEKDAPVLTYEKFHQEWRISTEIDLGATHPLTYHHTIHARVPMLLSKALVKGNSEKHHPTLGPIISPMSWMGISGGATHWDYLCEERLPSVINALSSFCSEFFDAMPLLLDGISPQGEEEARP